MRRHAFLRVACGRIAGPAALFLLGCVWMAAGSSVEPVSVSANRDITLTPALSLREREHESPRWFQSGGRVLAQTTRSPALKPKPSGLHPLPKGEGRGEGARPKNLTAPFFKNAATPTPRTWKPNFPDTALVPLGRFVFERNCAVCHGRLGDGWGELSRSLTPRPRDFTKGYFKFRSTPSGSLPTDEDLRRTIREGLAGTAMPIFDQMEERDVRAVTEFIKSLSPRWQQPTNYAPAVTIADLPTWFEEPEALRAQAEKGRQAFNQMCIACHGEDGSGNGPGAADLEDAWHHPIRPADLRKPSIRRGREPEEIVRILLTGMDGTPMISFAELSTEEQRWQLAAYVLQLREKASALPK